MKTALPYLLLIPLLIGCTGEPGPMGPVPIGNLAGNLGLISKNHEFLVDKSGVTVRAGNFEDSAVTLADGSWLLKSVPAGIYSIQFSKLGYFSYQLYNIQFVGGGTYTVPYSFNMEEFPDFRVIHLSVTQIDSAHYVHFQGIVSSPDSLDRVACIFVMKSYPQDSSSFQFIDFVEVGVLAGSVSFEGIWYPIPRTSAIRYATATPGLFWGTVWQINPLTQTHDFAAPGLSRSNVVTFISP